MSQSQTQSQPLNGTQNLGSTGAVPANSPPEGSYCFAVEWNDPQAGMVRKYQLFYFLADGQIELYDIKNRRVFLKRCKYPGISQRDLFVGAQVTIYARQLKVVGYGDEVTKKKLESNTQRSVALIKPQGINRLGNVLTTAYANDLIISKLKMLQLTPQQAAQFYGDSDISARAKELSVGPVVALELIGKGNDVQQQLAQLAETKTDTSGDFTDVYVATSDRAADMEYKFLFENPQLSSPALLQNTSVAVIKPHAVQNGDAGDIINTIQGAGFVITAAELFYLDRTAAEEFSLVYKGVLPEYNAIVEHYTSGPSIVLEVKHTSLPDGLDVVQALRQLAGPHDSEIARSIRPNSIRAAFGVQGSGSSVKNSIHVTDLSDDGTLESQFFFSILQKK